MKLENSQNPTRDVVLDHAQPVDVIRDERGLRVTAVIGRVGVNTYIQPDGSLRKEFRPPESLFAADSMKSAEILPVTNGHPADDQLPLNSENLKYFQVGSLGDRIEQDGDKLKARMRISDTAALQAIENGRRKVSPGYIRTAVYAPGVYQGEAYDYRQEDIVYDHIALVDKARGGPDVRLLLDGKILGDSKPMDKNATVRIKGAEYTLDAGTATAFQQLMEEKANELSVLKDRADKLEAERDAAVARAEKAEKELADKPVVDSAEQLDAQVAERLQLVETARRVCDNFEYKGQSADDIRFAVVSAAYPQYAEKYPSAEPAYKQALFDLALDSVEKKEEDKQEKIESALGQAAPVTDAADKEFDDLRAKFNARATAKLSELVGA